MDIATLLAAAAHEPAEHSADLFLIVGGVLAAFAVVVAVIGIARPAFPGRAATALMGVGAVLVAGTMVSIVAVS